MPDRCQSASSSRPRRSRWSRSLTALLVGTLGASVWAVLPTGVAAAAPAGAADPVAKLAPSLRTGDQRVTAFVRITGEGALAVDARTKNGVLAGKPRSAAAKARVSAVLASTASVASAAEAIDGGSTPVYSTAYTVPGLTITATAATLRRLALRSDVVSIVPVTPKSIVRPKADQSDGRAVGASDVSTRATAAWRAGLTGTGVEVAVIDTGLDYTHLDFGGTGTAAAYDAASATNQAPPTNSKYLGGYDFAGQSYAPEDGEDQPEPDANPIDFDSHGTHVTGTLAGYGVTGRASTAARYTGNYTTLADADLGQFTIAPGTAPRAGVWALKVFGDVGQTTLLTGQALDWVAQKVTEGRPIKIVNMSLGSDFTPPDDPDNTKVSALAAQGILSVVAAGNAGDATDVSGSPGQSAASLTVAAADAGFRLYDGLTVTDPSGLAGRYPGLLGTFIEQAVPVTDTAVATLPAPNADGCGTSTDADLAALKGKVLWLEPARAGCTVDDQAFYASGTEAVGVVVVGTSNSPTAAPESGGFPAFLLTPTAAATLRPAALAGTLAVSIGADGLRRFPVLDPDRTDRVAPFSSRGTHGSYGDVVKPDLTGPGVDVVSALTGSGSSGVQYSGTSMATPAVSGVAALVFQAHPTRSGAEVKAVLMNTAVHDVRSTTGLPLSNLRQGAGRVDAVLAAAATVAATADTALVTASFGVVEVAGPTTLTRTVRVADLSGGATTPPTYGVSYLARLSQPGVTVTVSPTQVTVPAAGAATVTVTLRITDPTALRRVLDPSQPAGPSGAPNDVLAQTSGLVVLTPTAGGTSALRVPVFSAPEPVSAVTAQPVSFAGSGATSATMTLGGRAVGQGSGATAYTSTAAPFVLGAYDAADPIAAGLPQQTLTGLDLRAVGAASSAPLVGTKANGMVWFGVLTRGPIGNPGGDPFNGTPGGQGGPVVYIDVNRDGVDDFLTWAVKSETGDRTVVQTFRLRDLALVDEQPYGGVTPGGDNNTFDSAVAVLPVRLGALGYTNATRSGLLTYQVRTVSYYAPASNDPTAYPLQADAAAKVTFDVLRPSLWFTQTGVSAASPLMRPGTPVSVRRAVASTAQVLLLTPRNAVGSQGAAVKVTTVPRYTPVAGKGPAIIGTPRNGVTVRASVGTWTPSGAAYTVQWTRNGVAVPGATAATYRCTAADVGKKLSFRVTARKVGVYTGTADAPAKIVAR